MANPEPDEGEKVKLIRHLVAARRAVRDAKASSDGDAEVAAHHADWEAIKLLFTGEEGYRFGRGGLLRSRIRGSPSRKRVNRIQSNLSHSTLARLTL